MSYNICDEPLSTCPAGDVTRDLSGGGHNTVTHAKSATFGMTVGGVLIPLRTRNRTFSIGYAETWSWLNLHIVIDAGGYNATDCGTKTGSGHGDISENATFTDSELVFVDHVNEIAMWRERVETQVWDQTTTKTAQLKTTWGGFYPYWFEITPVINRVESWKLLVNGTVEVIETFNDPVTLGKFNILYPLPPSLASPDPDPEKCPPVFYDYNVGPDDYTLAELDGGKDFYYPEWIRGMGLDKTIDQAEATERFEAYFFNQDREPQEVFPLPGLGYAKPYGNAVKDAEGNILLSYQTPHNSINRLYTAEGAVINLDIPKIMDGSMATLYPVGVL